MFREFAWLSKSFQTRKKCLQNVNHGAPSGSSFDLLIVIWSIAFDSTGLMAQSPVPPIHHSSLLASTLQRVFVNENSTTEDVIFVFDEQNKIRHPEATSLHPFTDTSLLIQKEESCFTTAAQGVGRLMSIVIPTVCNFFFPNKHLAESALILKLF